MCRRLPGVLPPVLWGDEATVRQRLAANFSDIETRLVPVEFDLPVNPAGAVDFFRKYFGPTQVAFGRLDGAGQAAFAKELEELWAAHNVAPDPANRTLIQKISQGDCDSQVKAAAGVRRRGRYRRMKMFGGDTFPDCAFPSWESGVVQDGRLALPGEGSGHGEQAGAERTSELGSGTGEAVKLTLVPEKGSPKVSRTVPFFESPAPKVKPMPGITPLLHRLTLYPPWTSKSKP